MHIDIMKPDMCHHISVLPQFSAIGYVCFSVQDIVFNRDYVCLVIWVCLLVCQFSAGWMDVSWDKEQVHIQWVQRDAHVERHLLHHAQQRKFQVWQPGPEKVWGLQSLGVLCRSWLLIKGVSQWGWLHVLCVSWKGEEMVSMGAAQRGCQFMHCCSVLIQCHPTSLGSESLISDRLFFCF
jgi:hypothetical protein